MCTIRVGRLSVDSRPMVDRWTSDCRPIYQSNVGRCIDRYEAINCRSSIGDVWVMYRSRIGHATVDYGWSKAVSVDTTIVGHEVPGVVAVLCACMGGVGEVKWTDSGCLERLYMLKSDLIQQSLKY